MVPSQTGNAVTLGRGRFLALALALLGLRCTTRREAEPGARASAAAARVPGPSGITRAGVAYSDAGSGRPIIFVHGVSFDRVYWSPALEVLGSSYRCVALDLPGHGDTTFPCDGEASAVAAIADVIDALGLERPLLVGHSAGAVFAGFYAAKHDVSGVVNVDQPLMAGAFARLLQQMEGELRGPAFRAAFGRLERGFGYDRIPAELRDLAQARCRPVREVVLAYWAALLEQSPSDAQSHLERRTRGCRGPYFVLHTRELGPAYEAWLRELLAPQEVSIEVWPDRGHFPHLAEANRFNDWLRRIAAKVWRQAEKP